MMSNVITNGRLATRLRRERERLGLTQQEFADKVGVSRMSQVNYESGKRYPGEAYFKALEAMEGLDVLYLWTGRRQEDLNDETAGAQFLFRATAETLGLDSDAFEIGLEEMTRSVAAVKAEAQKDPEVLDELDDIADRQAKEILARSPAILSEDTFLSVVQTVEEILLECPARLPPEKKARLLLMLYRQHRAAGKLDGTVVLDAITLAE